MTKLRISLAALVLAGSFGTAFAAAPAPGADSEFSPDGVECAFVAETGGYQCVHILPYSSLSEPNEGNGKRLPKISAIQKQGLTVSKAVKF